jgi:hypothetical protein
VLARGTLDGVETEFCFLDDPANPLTLRFKIGYGTMQVIKISYPVEGAATGIEQGLKETGRTEVYGIYFDFGEATMQM